MDPDEQERAKRAQELAIEKAVRDALVDRTLLDHDAHLKQINGSQGEMAASLAALKGQMERMTVSAEAVATYVTERTSSQFSTRSLWIAGVAAVATWLAIVATLVTTVA